MNDYDDVGLGVPLSEAEVVSTALAEFHGDMAEWTGVSPGVWRTFLDDGLHGVKTCEL